MIKRDAYSLALQAMTTEARLGAKRAPESSSRRDAPRRRRYQGPSKIVPTPARQIAAPIES